MKVEFAILYTTGYSPVCARSSAEDLSDGCGVGVEEATSGLAVDSAGGEVGSELLAGVGGSTAAGVGGAAAGAAGALTSLFLMMFAR